jgi:hypothetical protein
VTGECLFGAIQPGGVQHGEDGETPLVNLVGDYIRGSRYDEFPGTGFAPRVTEMRMARKPLDGSKNLSGHATSGGGLVLFDVFMDFDEIRDCGRGPNYAHGGGGSGCFPPQERSHRETLLWETVRPA